MKRWYVVTPEYGVVDPILDDGTGPLEYVSDVIEIEADTARDAVAFGVKLMLKAHRRAFKWCRDQASSNCSPYAGVRAIPVGEEDHSIICQSSSF